MNKKYDVVIIGSGIAGLYAALLLEPTLRIIVLTKEKLEDSNSYLAQGGISVAIDQESDDLEDYMNDTLCAGAGLNNQQALQVLVQESLENIRILQLMGVKFDRINEKLALTKEAGHSKARILHINGDATGKGLVDTLLREIRSRPNITIKEDSFCLDLLRSNDLCIGVQALEKQNVFCYYATRAVILATGGIGMVYGITTNACTITGDGIAMAQRTGVEIDDMEFIQFHPTVFHNCENKRFLISEAVRGEGGILRNINGEKFMHNYDKRQELAFRDVVSRAVMCEIEKTKAEHVYLDLTHLDSNYVVRRFPNITAKCKEYGIDITKQYIPVSPAQHYVMGGIKTNLWGRTSLPGLYVCGESACTGVHGANRLASNSLLEALVFANRAAQSINNIMVDNKQIPLLSQYTEEYISTPECSVKNERESIQRLMRKYAGITRRQEGLASSLQELRRIEEALQKKKCLNKDFMECYNMLTVSKLVINKAMMRKESVGAHYMACDS